MLNHEVATLILESSVYPWWKADRKDWDGCFWWSPLRL